MCKTKESEHRGRKTGRENKRLQNEPANQGSKLQKKSNAKKHSQQNQYSELKFTPNIINLLQQSATDFKISIWRILSNRSEGTTSIKKETICELVDLKRVLKNPELSIQRQKI